MTIKITRRGLLAATGSMLAGAALPMPAIAQKAPIRIGTIMPLSGIFQVDAEPMLVGTQVGIENINRAGGVDGRMLELVVRDDATNVAKTAAAVRELKGAGINLIIGPFPTANVIAAVPVLADTQTIGLSCGAQTMSLTHELFTPYHFRLVDNVWMRDLAYGKLIARKYPDVTTWTAIVADSATTLQAWRIFARGLQQEFTRQGKTLNLVEPVRVGPEQVDFRSQIQQLLASGAEGILSSVSAAQSVSFFTQSKPFNFGQRFKVVTEIGNEFIVTNAMKSSTPKNYWSTTDWYYDAYMDTKEGKELFDGYVAKTKQTRPPGFACPGQAGAIAFAAAIAKAGSTASNDIIAALEGMTFPTARGPCTLRKEDHQAIVDINIIGFRPSDAAPGWEVTEFLKLDGKDVVEPAQPGKPFDEAAG